jgi:hypothetical protein
VTLLLWPLAILVSGMQVGILRLWMSDQMRGRLSDDSMGYTLVNLVTYSMRTAYVIVFRSCTGVSESSDAIDAGSLLRIKVELDLSQSC